MDVESSGSEQVVDRRGSGLWSDEPATEDLLSFDAVAKTVAEAVLDDSLDPLAIGVSGPWGSGKTTILRLLEKELKETELPPRTEVPLAERVVERKPKVLVIATDPWRYDPSIGVKETLIEEILNALEKEIASATDPDSKGRQLLAKLKSRIDWSKAIQLALNGVVTLQVPSVQDLASLVKGDAGDSIPVRGMGEFHTEFASLIGSSELRHLRRVVVLVDDLDRCLYPTVVETLETIRLFLSVPNMAFVIAADEKRVADALRERFPSGAAGAGVDPVAYEHPADLYLHKIVQTTVALPALSRFDTEAYLVLLQLKSRIGTVAVAPYIAKCASLRRDAREIDELTKVNTADDITSELTLAARLTPILYEKLLGNPRRIKRFLNDLRVRQSIAEQRGIDLDADVVAKLMVLEALFTKEFVRLTGWLAAGELKEHLLALERFALESKDEGDDQSQDGSAEPGGAETTERGDLDEGGDVDPRGFDESGEKGSGGELTGDTSLALDGSTEEFSEDLRRWALVPPTRLSGLDLAPYLYLAASFQGAPLIATGLSAHLRDIVVKLMGGPVRRRAVTEEMLKGLSRSDAERLVTYLVATARDSKSEQRDAMSAVVRITEIRPEILPHTISRLQTVRADDLDPGTVLVFSEMPHYHEVVVPWYNASSPGPTRKTLGTVAKIRNA
ncbi:KAP family P-loop NTPase fold protein [Rhodococcus triatomae]